MREMKDSGIEWVGKIPHCWNTSKLKYLGQYINGYAFKPEEWGSKGVPIIRIQDLTGSNDNPNYFEGQIDKKYWVENGDILISWAATLDAFIWNKGKGWLNQHIFKAVPNRRIINYDFFFWMIKESMKNMNNDNKHGIFMQHVTLSVFNNFTIPMPPLAEQERIAAFLDAECAEIDAVLEKTRASIEEYKKLKQAVITQAVTKGIRGDRPMKDSGIEWIGEIPAEWTASKIKYCTEFAPSCNTSHLSEDSLVTFTPMECIKNGYFENREAHFSALSSSYTQYQDGDIVFAKVTPCFENGNIAIMQGLSAGVGFGSSELFVIRPQSINTEFIFYYLQNDIFKQYACATMTGTGGLKRVSPTFVRNYSVFIPCNEEQLEIVRYLNEKCSGIEVLIAKKQQYLTEIENYKKSLIYEYVTGKKEVV